MQRGVQRRVLLPAVIPLQWSLLVEPLRVFQEENVHLHSSLGPPIADFSALLLQRCRSAQATLPPFYFLYGAEKLN